MKKILIEERKYKTEDAEREFFSHTRKINGKMYIFWSVSEYVGAFSWCGEPVHKFYKNVQVD